jgi:hypothetical protein
MQKETDQNGLYRIYDSALDHYGVAEGLSGGSILSITEDHDGGLSVATPRELDHFRDLRVETLSGTDGLRAELDFFDANQTIKAIHRARNQSRQFATVET